MKVLEVLSGSDELPALPHPLGRATETITSYGNNINVYVHSYVHVYVYVYIYIYCRRISVIYNPRSSRFVNFKIVPSEMECQHVMRNSVNRIIITVNCS